MTKIARGEVLGIREEGTTLRAFVDKRYWPTVKATLAVAWADRSREILNHQILPIFGDSRLSKIRREAIESWYGARRQEVKASTANKELARLKHCLARAVAWGYLRNSPAANVTRAKESAGRVRYLEPAERVLLLDGGDVTVKSTDGRAWVTRREPSPVLRLYMLAALQTGARRSELVRLRWPDVDMRQRTITFGETKNGHSRTVPMTETLRVALQALPRPLKGDGPVFPERNPKVLSRMFARYVRALGLANLTFHDLRHDAASTLTMAGVSQRAVMELLGHRDPRMTIRYQHLSPGHLRDAMRTLDLLSNGGGRENQTAPHGTTS
jgi:integrase